MLPHLVTKGVMLNERCLNNAYCECGLASYYEKQKQPSWFRQPDYSNVYQVIIQLDLGQAPQMGPD